MRFMKGFTMLEYAITLILFGIIGWTGGILLDQMARSSVLHYTINENDWQARVAMERMARELRELRGNELGNLVTIEPNEISFVTWDGKSITYNLSGTTLMRNSQPLAENISNLTFEYLNSSGATETTSTLVRYITINLTVSDGENTQTMETSVFPKGF